MSGKAVALKYDQEINSAPAILAKGAGAVGNYIVELAKKSQVPVYRNDQLVESLFHLRENEEIPGDLYNIVAEIFAFVYSLKAS